MAPIGFREYSETAMRLCALGVLLLLSAQEGEPIVKIFTSEELARLSKSDVAASVVPPFWTPTPTDAHKVLDAHRRWFESRPDESSTEYVYQLAGMENANGERNISVNALCVSELGNYGAWRSTFVSRRAGDDCSWNGLYSVSGEEFLLASFRIKPASVSSVSRETVEWTDAAEAGIRMPICGNDLPRIVKLDPWAVSSPGLVARRQTGASFRVYCLDKQGELVVGAGTIASLTRRLTGKNHRGCQSAKIFDSRVTGLSVLDAAVLSHPRERDREGERDSTPSAPLSEPFAEPLKHLEVL